MFQFIDFPGSWLILVSKVFANVSLAGATQFYINQRLHRSSVSNGKKKSSDGKYSSWKDWHLYLKNSWMFCKSRKIDFLTGCRHKNRLIGLGTSKINPLSFQNIRIKKHNFAVSVVILFWNRVFLGQLREPVRMKRSSLWFQEIRHWEWLHGPNHSIISNI